MPCAIYAQDRTPMGTSKLRDEIQKLKFKPKRKLKVASLFEDELQLFRGKVLAHIYFLPLDTKLVLYKIIRKGSSFISLLLYFEVV